MATTTSTRCWGSFLPSGPRARLSSGCGPNKVDGVATWLIHGVTSAFFASLEKCSCIRVTTVEDAEDLNELPLIYDDGNLIDNHLRNMKKRTGRSRKKGEAYNGNDQ